MENSNQVGPVHLFERGLKFEKGGALQIMPSPYNLMGFNHWVSLELCNCYCGAVLWKSQF